MTTASEPDSNHKKVEVSFETVSSSFPPISCLFINFIVVGDGICGRRQCGQFTEKS